MTNLAQRTFAKGELAPGLYSRTDQAAYGSGLRTCRNWIVRRQGGVDNRPGMEFCGLARAGRAKLLPFVFNDAQTYVLEFSGFALRFLQNGAYVGGGYAIVTPYATADLQTLQIAQSADVVTIVHPNYPPYELKRFGDTNWTLTPVVFNPPIAAPSGVVMSPAGGDGLFHAWVVTAIDTKTGSESFPSAIVGVASVALPQERTITWAPVTGALGYNVYAAQSQLGSGLLGSFGFVGTVQAPAVSFYDKGITPDYLDQPPAPRPLFASAGNYPGAVTIYQQRRIFSGSLTQPDTVYTSRSGDYRNFLVSSPTQDDDAVTFTLASTRINPVRHLVDHGSLLILTAGGEWLIGGDGAGVLRPTDVNASNVSTHGASPLVPLRVDRRLLYVQARNAVVRDVAKDPWYGYKGTDLTVFSAHLFEGRTLTDWAYQEVPHSIVWAVRDDGTLLGLTDVDEQQVLAWHRHDTLGTIENVCVIPEGGEDRLYLVVVRNGVRMVERMASRYAADPLDAIFSDATVSYDGRNTSSTTITLSALGGWTYDQPISATASSALFSASDVGLAYVLTAADGSTVRLVVQSYVSPTLVTGFPAETVPTSLHNVPTMTWAKASTTFAGLSHLNGRSVAVVGDGQVVSSPNNPALTFVATVVAGQVTLDRPYARVHVGLPYVSDLETLDLDSASGPSLKEKKLLIDRVLLNVVGTRGLFAGSGPPVSDRVTAPLQEFTLRSTELFGQPTNPVTGTITVNTTNSWSNQGRVFVRQTDPVPASILAVFPTGFIPQPSP